MYYKVHTNDDGSCEIVKIKPLGNGHIRTVIATIMDGYADVDAIRQLVKKANTANTQPAAATQGEK